MTPGIQMYLELERRMLLVRDRNNGHVSHVENDLVDWIEEVWSTLTEEEQGILNNEDAPLNLNTE